MSKLADKRKGFYITIWDVEIIDESSNTVIGNQYFLSFRRAVKWRKKNEESFLLEGFRMAIGGEDLWLW